MLDSYVNDDINDIKNQKHFFWNVTLIEVSEMYSYQTCSLCNLSKCAWFDNNAAYCEMLILSWKKKNYSPIDSYHVECFKSIVNKLNEVNE